MQRATTQAPAPDAQSRATGLPDSVTEAQALVGARYRIERIAGEGGMGKVLLATDTVLSRRVAIKLLRGVDRPVTGDPSARDRLLGEARAMAGLNHPNICRVLEISLAGQPGHGVPFMVMEWVDGLPLAEAWRELSPAQRVELFLKIADGVAAAHAAGFVHSDLKPWNILLDRSGQPVIVDFGLARAGGQSAAAGDTGPIYGGTPGYAAPEQFQPGGVMGPWSDVYALGVMLFEMLTGRRPFQAASTAELLAAQREQDPPLPEELAPETPPPLQRICLAALERDPPARYQNAGELAQDLRRYQRGETVWARPTMLAARFVDKVQEHLEHARQWRRQSLITDSEHRAIARSLRSVLRPDSPWIIDSRRLSASQVSLYLGGWLVVIGLTVGAFWSWDSLSVPVKLLFPGAVALALVVAGGWLSGKGHQRAGLAYLITACLAIPVALVLIFKHTGWFTGADGLGMGNGEFFAGREGSSTRSPPPGGLYNTEIFISALAWLAAAVTLRLVSGSSAFTFVGSIATVCAGLGLWLVTGGYHAPSDGQTWANLAVWTMAMGLAGVGAGLWLSVSEERDVARKGAQNVRRADAWPLLTIGVLLLTAGLATTAWFAPQRLLIPSWLASGESWFARRAIGTIAVGTLLLGLSWVLSRGYSLARDRLVLALRWLIPTTFLAPLVVLREERLWGTSWLWIISLGTLAITMSYASVARQWKPFLANGLAYTLVAYVMALHEVGRTSDSTPVRIAMMAGIVAVGLTTMILAWWGPIWIASTRGRRLLATARHTLESITSASRTPKP